MRFYVVTFVHCLYRLAFLGDWLPLESTFALRVVIFVVLGCDPGLAGFCVLGNGIGSPIVPPL